MLRPEFTANTILSAIGNTPLIEFEQGMWTKCEHLNPTGSVKARLAAYLVDRAEQEGILKPGMTIVEATSGNTGNALSMVAAARGYKMVMLMPSAFSMERVAISAGLGAEIRLLPGMDITPVRELALKLGAQEGWWCPQQFDNQGNVEQAREWLGREIVSQIPAGVTIDAVVHGVGTGGTILGVAQALKQWHNPALKAYVLEPKGATMIQDGSFAPHKIEGIGDGFIPSIYAANKDVIDGFITIDDTEAVETAQMLGRTYGTLVGMSSGAGWLAAKMLRAQHPEFKNVLLFFADIGEKYLHDRYEPLIEKQAVRVDG